MRLPSETHPTQSESLQTTARGGLPPWALVTRHWQRGGGEEGGILGRGAFKTCPFLVVPQKAPHFAEHGDSLVVCTMAVPRHLLFVSMRDGLYFFPQQTTRSSSTLNFFASSANFRAKPLPSLLALWNGLSPAPESDHLPPIKSAHNHTILRNGHVEHHHKERGLGGQRQARCAYPSVTCRLGEPFTAKQRRGGGGPKRMATATQLALLRQHNGR